MAPINTYISIPLFFVSFVVGIVCIFIFGPETKTVKMYPSPDNYEELIYQDNADQCFHMFPKEIDCPSDKNLIQDVPIQ